MTKRICFIGNSHLIMVQEAWKARQDDSSVDADFFACLIKHFKELHVQNGKLVPEEGKLKESFLRSHGGDGIIDPDRYDVFVLTGMRVGLIGIYRLMRTYALTGTDLTVDNAKHLIGEPLLKEWVREELDGGDAFRFIRMLREITDKPIMLVPQPAPAEKILGLETGAHLPPKGAEFFQVVQTAFEDGLKALCQTYGLTLWEQPDDTLISPGLTDNAFLAGAKSFSGKAFPEDDVGHMNAEMGKRALDAAVNA